MALLQVQDIIAAKTFDVYQHMTSPDNLKSLLDGLVDVEWINKGVEIQPSAEFHFKMRRFKVEQTVKLVVDKYVTGNWLTYHQSHGLLASWRHTMKFSELQNGQTLVTDIVEYEVPFGFWGRIIDDLFAHREIKKILKHRLQRAKLQLQATNTFVQNGHQFSAAIRS